MRSRAVLPGRRVLVVAGPGNNGGDGFVAARLSPSAAIRCASALSATAAGSRAMPRSRPSAGAARSKPAAPAALGDCDIVIDALFGAGLDRAVEGLPRAMIEAMNAARRPVIAVDLPSGVNGTTGAVMGVAVKASQTVTFFRRKTGHLLLPGRLHCGTVQVADIGIPERVLETIKPTTFANRPGALGARSSRCRRRRATNMRAAMPWWCRAAFRPPARRGWRRAARCGQAPGLVTIASPREALAVNAAASLAVMVRPVDGAAELAEFLADKRRNAVVLGPGGGVGQAMREQVAAALASEAAVVLDADALTSFAG